MNQTPPSLTICLKTYHSLCIYPICKDKKKLLYSKQVQILTQQVPHFKKVHCNSLQVVQSHHIVAFRNSS